MLLLLYTLTFMYIGKAWERPQGGKKNNNCIYIIKKHNSLNIILFTVQGFVLDWSYFFLHTRFHVRPEQKHTDYKEKRTRVQIDIRERYQLNDSLPSPCKVTVIRMITHIQIYLKFQRGKLNHLYVYLLQEIVTIRSKEFSAHFFPFVLSRKSFSFF